MKARTAILALVCGLALGGVAWAELYSFTGPVVGVSAGDEFVVARSAGRTPIRLASVKRPDSWQKWSNEARAFTAKAVRGQQVTVSVSGADACGRSVAEVTLPDGRSLNQELVRAGLAWSYRLDPPHATIDALEAEAKAAKRGLWSDPDPMPPWTFRELHNRRGCP
jgi:endonuclease YncB( thermonuclease family)